ncbi:hypothetical protein GGH94_005918 [Coemansia aciculifera]|uniref:HSF-type DNA-binding domain-containing protein n=1 Tax=Coemansia aciculifera TaxID=417176 RepID=A0A9W8ICW1_9FUNG|nr:hypothetical protein GGH94_005918 [Coemansia aciculifera]
MGCKRSTPTATEPRTKKKERLSTNDTLATDSNTESVSSHTRSRSRSSTHNTNNNNNNNSRRARRLSSCSEQPLAILLPATEVAPDSASIRNHPATSGAVAPDAGRNGTNETSSNVVSLADLNSSLVNLPGVVSQSFMPEYLPTPSPALAADPITPTSTHGHTSPPLSLRLPSRTTAARHKLKKPTMAFKYAIYRIVSNEGYRSWVKWNEEGNQLYIGNWDFFIDTLVDLGFSATGRTSVMRNFYSYGFKLDSDGRCRVPDENGVTWSILYHDKFLRDQPELLKDIKRVAPPRKQ